MKWLPWLTLWAAASAALLRGQTMAVTVLTEFRRTGPDGKILAADAVGTPREIVSPAIVRNGYTSFHLVVTGPPLGKFMLYIASNPDQVLRPVLYRAAAGQDKLEPVKGLSEAGQFNDRGVGVYWLDIWTPASAPVRRIRLEAQLNMDREFAIAPLELRVQPAVVPPADPPMVSARQPGGNSAAGAFALFDRTLCGGQAESKPRDEYEPLSISGKIMRNAGQDMLLARKLGGAAAADVKAWCAMPLDRGNPESYLRLRDAIWRASQ